MEDDMKTLELTRELSKFFDEYIKKKGGQITAASLVYMLSLVCKQISSKKEKYIERCDEVHQHMLQYYDALDHKE